MKVLAVAIGTLNILANMFCCCGAMACSTEDHGVPKMAKSCCSAEVLQSCASEKASTRQAMTTVKSSCHCSRHGIGPQQAILAHGQEAKTTVPAIISLPVQRPTQLLAFESHETPAWSQRHPPPPSRSWLCCYII